MRGSDAPDAAASAGSCDVLLFMEFESCPPSAAAWSSVVADHLAAGGRVVITYGGAGGATFINDLGFFGTGTSASVTTPFLEIADPFWTGITHPGSHSATTGWAWSGPGLIPLGQETGGTDLTVWGYDVF